MSDLNTGNIRAALLQLRDNPHLTADAKLAALKNRFGDLGLSRSERKTFKGVRELLLKQVKLEQTRGTTVPVRA